MAEKNTQRLVTKCYDSIDYGYLYGFNEKIALTDLEKVKPYMKKFGRQDFQDGTKVSGVFEGWLCTRENVSKVEEILGITDTVEKREQHIKEKLENPETRDQFKEQAIETLELVYNKGSTKPPQDLSRLLLHSAKVYDPSNAYRDGKDEGLGTLFIYTPHAIWYILNNSSPGSDHSLNNVATPEGGAIGLRLVYSDALDRLVRIVSEENEYQGD